MPGEFESLEAVTEANKKYRIKNPIKNPPPDLETLNERQLKRYLDKQAKAATIKSKGGYFLDAPVSGGTFAAEIGKLAIMVGGDKKIFEKTKNLLKSMGTVTYVGKTGSGQVAKLANQAIVGITIGAVSEALILAEAAGADPKAVRKAIKNGFAGSPILEIHGKRILEKNFEPGGKCSTQLKDMKNIIETAKTYKIHLPLSEKIKKLYEIIVEEGKSNLDHSALYLLIKKLKKHPLNKTSKT